MFSIYSPVDEMVESLAGNPGWLGGAAAANKDNQRTMFLHLT